MRKNRKNKFFNYLFFYFCYLFLFLLFINFVIFDFFRLPELMIKSQRVRFFKLTITKYYSIIVQGTKKFPEEIDLEIN